ncbi:metal-dependent hydrolase [Brevibacillus sp. SYP-B805]|uniref:endonuclease/exonuclease/phosphatase family protein n=1 Tax=Brevibacillus sp. SYP-B805 TaxID=1578199 RepID=UPI0013EDB266|nr:endonuclease/exonuclease/phosphatase family protein [Brevibacillus sp. SYP-B805]NGQ94090.1 metal-dependent hydrolase [Brevibacillus sp. SYP-B805]
MLRVVSYNIHGGKDLFWRNRLDEMAETLSALDADIIGLQEVHQNERFGYQADYLAERLQAHYAYAPSVKIGRGAYGNMLLTRLPLIHSSSQLLQSKKEPRSLLRAAVKWEEKRVNVWVTHCSLDRKSRFSQWRFLADAISPRCHEPLILLGDFNSPAVSFAPHLRDCARETNRHQLSTLVPFAKRVDFVFASAAWEVAEYKVVHVRWSDHYPVLVTLTPAQRPIPAG